MWKIVSHILRYLTNIMSSKEQFKFTENKKKEFEKIKWIFIQNKVLDFTEFNKWFDINNNEINFQCEVVKSKKGENNCILQL